MNTQPLLKTNGLTVGYPKGRVLLENLNLTINAGEVVCIIGANGSGKSTLLRTLAAAQAQLSGSVNVRGRELSRIPAKEIAKEIGLVFTDSTNAGGLTVTEMVSLGRYPHTGFFGRLTAEDKDIVQRAIAAVGIEHKSDGFVAELSDGERQKAMIAKALAQQTPLIILDEPTAFLDIASKIDTMRLLHKLAHTQGKGVIVSSHDISQALLLSDRLWIVTTDGELIQGGTEDIVLSGCLNSIFKGDAITFDAELGVFTSVGEYTKDIFVSGSREDLAYWCGNAMRRNGINTSNNDTNIKVYIQRPNAIQLKNRAGDILQLFTSIKDLILYLKR